MEALRLAAGQGEVAACKVYADWLADRCDPEELVYRLAASEFNHTSIIEGWYGWPAGTVARGNRGEAGRFWGNSKPGGEVEGARQVVAIVAKFRGDYERAAADIRLENTWKEKAWAGDAEALLAYPPGRVGITQLALGNPAGRGYLPTSFTASRKAIAIAKARMAAREHRRANRAVAEDALQGLPGRIMGLYLQKLRTRAVEMAEKYHAEVRKLYRSVRASVVYGEGGQQGYDRDAYSQRYRSRFGGARWCNAGARLDSEDRPRFVIVEDYRGVEVARLPL